MIYLIFAGFFAVSLFDSHQVHVNEAKVVQVEKTSLAEVMKEKTLEKKPKQKQLQRAELDGIELVNLGEVQHA